MGQPAVPAPLTVAQTSSQVAPGYIFITPSAGGGSSSAYSNGAEIVDNEGRPVWFHPVSGIASDLRVQTYQGKPVITWSESPVFEDTTPGSATDYIADTGYNIIASFQAGDGLNADQHEFSLTPEGTALITCYDIVQADLTSVGGSGVGAVLEGSFQEIDPATGQVLLDWHSIDHVPLTESMSGYGPGQPQPYDYFHINSVNLDTDGNILVSSRHCWCVYKINRSTGDIMWRLGGKSSNYTLGPGLPFAWQHDALAADSQTLRIFDNESNGVAVLPYSRAIWVRHDDTAMTATLVRSIEHPAALSVIAEGSVEDLPNGDAFVEWGLLGRYSEFDAGNTLIYDVTPSTGFGSYRGYRFPWTGTPAGSPAMTVVSNANGTLTVDAVWNGATQVASWNLMGASSPGGAMGSVGTFPWNGLDTTITLTTTATSLQAVAMDAMGNTLGQSRAVSNFGSALPAVTSQPQSQTVASNDAAVFRVAATGGSLAYQWIYNGTPLSDGPWWGSVGLAVPQLLPATVTGSAGPVLEISGAESLDNGSLACIVSNSAGTVTSANAYLSVVDSTDMGRLINVSCLAQAGGVTGQLITGFAIGGTQASGSEDVLVRASGPALTSFGTTGVIPDPSLSLYGAAQGNTLLGSNTGWGGSAQVSSAASAVGAFAWTDPTSADSALVETLPMGPYTANIMGASGDSGIALAEVYDATPPGTYTPQTPHLINVSALAPVNGSSTALVAGFVIGGSTSRTVLIRASGPALQQFGVSGTLSDPFLTVYNAANASVIASNDDWGGDPEISSAAAAVGAFAWTNPASPDCALLVTLPPGAYTANVTGVNGASGAALVEVYEVP
ncbi:MAG TPA: arylsulfotransferase family protein [Opitutaceae bacterium]